MAFAPIALTIPQYDKLSLANWWLKAYDQGTTTPLSMATDATGGTLLAKAQLDSEGFPITAGSARFIPFIDGDYDLWCFPTAAEADANDTTNAIQFADNLNSDPAASISITAGSYTVADKAAAVLLTPVSGKSLFVESTDGGTFYPVFDVPATFSDDGGAFCGTIFIPTGGDGSSGWMRSSTGERNVTWYGAIGDGVTDDTVAIQAANTSAFAVTGTVYFPAAAGYKYSPSASINIARWLGENITGSEIICDTTSYTGVFFVVDGVNRGAEYLTFTQSGGTKQATCLQISNVSNIDNFTGNVRIGPRIRISGFNKNIDIRNIFNLVFEQVRSEDGTYGVYCSPPDVAGLNGFTNTNWYYGCYFRFNEQNIVYDTPIISSNVVFIGGTSELAVGILPMNSFTSVRALQFIGFYMEGNDTQDALRLDGCDTTIDGMYMLSCGAINLDTNGNKITMRKVFAVGTNALFNATGGTSTQNITMDNCDWPSSGNVCTSANLTMINTTINGRLHKNTVHNNNAPTTGQITLTNNVATTVYIYVQPPSNGSGVMFDYQLTVTDSGEPRQVSCGRVHVAVQRPGSAAPAVTVAEAGQSLIAGTGALTVSFSATTDVNGFVNVLCTANSTGLTTPVHGFKIGGLKTFGNIALV